MNKSDADEEQQEEDDRMDEEDDEREALEREKEEDENEEEGEDIHSDDMHLLRRLTVPTLTVTGNARPYNLMQELKSHLKQILNLCPNGD